MSFPLSIKIALPTPGQNDSRGLVILGLGLFGHLLGGHLNRSFLDFQAKVPTSCPDWDGISFNRSKKSRIVYETIALPLLKRFLDSFPYILWTETLSLVYYSFGRVLITWWHLVRNRGMHCVFTRISLPLSLLLTFNVEESMLLFLLFSTMISFTKTKEQTSFTGTPSCFYF